MKESVLIRRIKVIFSSYYYTQSISTGFLIVYNLTGLNTVQNVNYVFLSVCTWPKLIHPIPN